MASAVSDWTLRQRRPPSAQGFQFSAESDGEYWFAVRTTDRSGRLISDEKMQPELKVIVDTKQPQLDVRVTTNSNGTATAEWFTSDPHLASNTFRLFYDNGQGQWQPVKVQTPNDRRQQWESYAEWTLPKGSRQVQVLAEVYDMAENQTRVTKTASGVDYSQARSRSRSAQSQFDTPFSAGSTGPESRPL